MVNTQPPSSKRSWWKKIPLAGRVVVLVLVGVVGGLAIVAGVIFFAGAALLNPSFLNPNYHSECFEGVHAVATELGVSSAGTVSSTREDEGGDFDCYQPSLQFEYTDTTAPDRIASTLKAHDFSEQSRPGDTTGGRSDDPDVWTRSSDGYTVTMGSRSDGTSFAYIKGPVNQ